MLQRPASSGGGVSIQWRAGRGGEDAVFDCRASVPNRVQRVVGCSVFET